MFYYIKLGVNKTFRYFPKYITRNTCLCGVLLTNEDTID